MKGNSTRCAWSEISLPFLYPFKGREMTVLLCSRLALAPLQTGDYLKINLAAFQSGSGCTYQVHNTRHRACKQLHVLFKGPEKPSALEGIWPASTATKSLSRIHHHTFDQ